MDLQMTKEDEALHEEAVGVCRHFETSAWHVIDILQRVEAANLHKKKEYPCLRDYAVDMLLLSAPVAYMFIAVARKAAVVPALQAVLKTQEVSANTVSRFISVINNENAVELIEFAKTHTVNEIDREVARRNPKAEGRARIRPVSETRRVLKLGISVEFEEDLRRAQAVMTKSNGTMPDYEATLFAALQALLDKNDPERKAQRAQERKAKKAKKAAAPNEAELCTNRVADEKPAQSGHKRVPLKAEEKHAVFARDGHRCTFRNEAGERCKSDKWLDVHHIIRVKDGGTNDPANLTVLCSFHHDLVHQLSFPIDYQVSWIRSPHVAYFN